MKVYEGLRNGSPNPVIQPSLRINEYLSGPCSPNQGWNPVSPPSMKVHHQQPPRFFKAEKYDCQQKKQEQIRKNQRPRNKITWFQSISPLPKKVIMRFSSPQRTFTDNYAVSRYFPPDKENKSQNQSKVPEPNTKQNSLSSSPIEILQRKMKAEEQYKLNILGFREIVQEDDSFSEKK